MRRNHAHFSSNFFLNFFVLILSCPFPSFSFYPPSSSVSISSLPKVLFEFGYEVVYGCGRGSIHQTCLALLTVEGGKKTKGKKEYVPHVLEAPSMELAQAICAHIGNYCGGAFVVM